MKYLVTGHTGFKGAWLTLLLHELGHTVSGLSLDPEPGSLFERAAISEFMAHDLRGDIRDPKVVADALNVAEPTVVLHMAAQPLVRESFRNPRFTYETNVLGTLNVLESVTHSTSVLALVIVTTDKVYRNVGKSIGYRESDALGGEDPYSASKAMADLLTQSWVHSFPGIPTAIARAGNVIGGGDVCRDRLLPDLLNAFSMGRSAEIRYPGATRPWQHVLDCLWGYLCLVDSLLQDSGTGSWNFAPFDEETFSVQDIAEFAAEYWGPGAHWETSKSEHPAEMQILHLDPRRARTELNWTQEFNTRESIKLCVDWQKSVNLGVNPLKMTTTQILDFLRLKEN